MCLLGDALYYNAALTLATLGAQGTLQQALQALSTTVFASRKSGGFRQASLLRLPALAPSLRLLLF